MTLVIDASVALKWFVDEDGSPQAAALLHISEPLIAPELIVAEVCNAAWKSVRAGTMLTDQQDYAAARLVAVFDELLSLAALASRAVEISRSLDHPVYDCFYLAASETRDAQLVTADRRLIQRVQGTRWSVLTTDLRGMT